MQLKNLINYINQAVYKHASHPDTIKKWKIEHDIILNKHCEGENYYYKNGEKVMK
jgi:hypothetical protein